jgi:hypothetical protein
VLRIFGANEALVLVLLIVIVGSLKRFLHPRGENQGGVGGGRTEKKIFPFPPFSYSTSISNTL